MNTVPQYLKHKHQIFVHNNSYQTLPYQLQSYSEVCQLLSSQEIACQKYNYNIDTELQNFDFYYSALTLSFDYKYLNIFSVKPVGNVERNGNGADGLGSDEEELEANKKKKEKIKFKFVFAGAANGGGAVVGSPNPSGANGIGAMPGATTSATVAIENPAFSIKDLINRSNRN